MFSEYPHLLFSLISISSAFFLGFLALFRYRSRGGINFAVLNFSMGIWQLGKLVKNTALAFPIDVDIGFWSSLSFAGATWVYPAFYRMACRLSFRDRGVFAWLSLLAIGSALVFTVLEARGHLGYGLRATPYGYYKDVKPLYFLYMGFYFGFMFLAAYLVYPGHYRKDLATRRQASAIFQGALVGFTLGGLEFVGMFGEPLYPLADLAPFIFGTALYWAIFRFNFLEAKDWLKNVLVGAGYFALLLLVSYALFHLNDFLLLQMGVGSGSFLSVFLFALVLFLVTPVALFLNTWIRRRFFPVRHSYRRIYVTLAARLADLDHAGAMFQFVLDEMRREFGYEGGTAVLFEYRDGLYRRENPTVLGRPLPPSALPALKRAAFPKLLSRKQILLQLRFGHFKEPEKHAAQMGLRLLSRLGADIGIPVLAKGQLAGVLLFPERSFRAEDWEQIADLLQSLAELLAAEVHQLGLLKAQGEQQHLSKLGTMAAGLAHELKNPLEGIYGAAQILKEEGKGNARFIDIVMKSAVRLHDIVQQYLQFARPFRLQLEKLDLSAWLENFVQEQNSLRTKEAAGPRLDYVEGSSASPSPSAPSSPSGAEAGPRFAEADPDGIRQILLNLVQNAKRHHEGEGPIRVVLRSEGAHLCVDVEDEGPGVDPQHRSRLFEPFFTTATKGTGLGLAISRRIAKEMGGDLVFAPKERGSRFTLSVKAPS